MKPLSLRSLPRKLPLIGGILFIVMFPHWVPLPFYSYALVCFLFIWLYLLRQGLSLKAMGLSLSALSIKKLFIGVLSGLVWLGFMLGVYIPLARYAAAGRANGYTEYNFLIGNLPVYLMTVLAAWLVGGVYEELAFRGFIRWGITRLAGKVPGARFYSAGIAAVLFGLYHIQQGWLGVIPATLGGLYWTWITVKYKGDLWPAIASHIVYDTAVLTLIYLDRFPGQH